MIELIDSLSTEEYFALLAIADGQVSDEIRRMTDQELLNELSNEVQS